MNTEEIKPRHAIVNFERRKHPRFSVHLPIDYYRVDSPTGHPGRVTNISEGGLLICLSEKIEIGQHLHLKLFLASLSEMHGIDVVVEAVWIEFHPEEGWDDYRCGVKFIDISSEDSSRLKDFLKSLTK